MSEEIEEKEKAKSAAKQEKKEAKKEAKQEAKRAKKEASEKKKRKEKQAEEIAEDIKEKQTDQEARKETKQKETENTEETVDSEETAEDQEENSEKKKKKRKRFFKRKTKPEEVNIVKELLSLIIYIGMVVLICFLIINFVGCRSKVDGSSMNPTLNHGDSLWVDKLSYTFGDPKRFDVIIFNYNEDTTYVKRIIGLPGEKVQIDQEGNIFINDQLLKESFGKERILPTNLGRANQPVLLGEDEYFVLGDNRNNSSDSRWADVGNVQREDIVGKVVLRIYPLSDFGLIK